MTLLLIALTGWALGAQTTKIDITQLDKSHITRVAVGPDDIEDLRRTPAWQWTVTFGRQFRGITTRPDLVKDQISIEIDGRTSVDFTLDKMGFLLTAGDVDGGRRFQSGTSEYQNFSVVRSPSMLPAPPAPGVTRVFVVGAVWCSFCKPRTGSLLGLLGGNPNVEIVYLEFKGYNDANLKVPIFKAFADAGALEGIADDTLSYPAIVVQNENKILTIPETAAVMTRLLSHRATPSRVAATRGSAYDRARIERVLMTSMFSDLGRLEINRLKTKNLAGVLVYRRKSDGMTSPNLRALFDELKGSSRDPYFIAVDQEGGQVQRIATEDTCRLPPAEFLAGKTNAQVRRFAEILTRDLLRGGVNFNFAPVLDLKRAGQRDITGWQRSVSADPREVLRVATILNDVMIGNGLLTMAKHVPGLAATVNTHEESATIDATFAEMRDSALLPFLGLMNTAAGLPAMMLGHVVMSKYDARVPLPFSKQAITTLVRREMNYDGLLVNDGFNMSAATDFVAEAEAPLRALLAGVAPIFVNNDSLEVSVDYILAQMRDPDRARVINAALDAAHDRISRAKAKMNSRSPYLDLSHGCTPDDVKFLRELSGPAYQTAESR